MEKQNLPPSGATSEKAVAKKIKSKSKKGSGKKDKGKSKTGKNNLMVEVDFDSVPVQSGSGDDQQVNGSPATGTHAKNDASKSNKGSGAKKDKGKSKKGKKKGGKGSGVQLSVDDDAAENGAAENGSAQNGSAGESFEVEPSFEVEGSQQSLSVDVEDDQEYSSDEDITPTIEEEIDAEFEGDLVDVGPQRHERHGLTYFVFMAATVLLMPAYLLFLIFTMWLYYLVCRRPRASRASPQTQPSARRPKVLNSPCPRSQTSCLFAGASLRVFCSASLAWGSKARFTKK